MLSPARAVVLVAALLLPIPFIVPACSSHLPDAPADGGDDAGEGGEVLAPPPPSAGASGRWLEHAGTMNGMGSRSAATRTAARAGESMRDKISPASGRAWRLVDLREDCSL